jgi:hypothetical protein
MADHQGLMGRIVSYYRRISDSVRLFIMPELDRRIKTGNIDRKDLPIELNQFRVLLPIKQSNPIIEFNNEVNLLTEIKLKRKKKINEFITIDDIYPETCFFLTPQVYEGEEAAFWYYKSLYFDFFIAFDFTPNIPEKFKNGHEASKIPFPLLNIINNKRYLEEIKPVEKLRALSDNNWPPGPAYYPDILLNIHQNPAIISDDNFINMVSSHYSYDYFLKKIKQWAELGLFLNRIPYIRRSIDAHFQDDFICSIYVIVPQFEGIIKDYLSECNNQITNGFSDCVKNLRRMIYSRNIILFPFEIFETIFNYLEVGSFWKNTKTISHKTSMINRHGIAHGLFTEFECKEISLKYLILMDALLFIILHDKIMAGSLQ